MSEEKVKLGFENSSFVVRYDGNADGKDSVKINLNLAEVVDELRNKDGGEEKKITVSMEGSKVLLKGDLNKDGEAFLEIEVDLLESLDEADIL